MVVSVAGGEDRLALAAKEALTQGLVTFLCGQQIGAVVITGRVAVELGAVSDQRTFQAFLEQPQTLDQTVNRTQHRPGDIVGVNLVAGHHQYRRPLLRIWVGLQQTVGAEQAIGRRVMRLAAGAMQQLVDALTQHQARSAGAGVEQVRRPAGNAFARIEQQVVFEGHVKRQRGVEMDIQQVDKSRPADGHGLAINLSSYTGVFKDEVQLQRLRSNQPDRQALTLHAAQYRASEDKG